MKKQTHIFPTHVFYTSHKQITHRCFIYRKWFLHRKKTSFAYVFPVRFVCGWKRWAVNQGWSCPQGHFIFLPCLACNDSMRLLL